MIEEDEISEVAFMDGFIEGYETAERELISEVEELREIIKHYQAVLGFNSAGFVFKGNGDAE